MKKILILISCFVLTNGCSSNSEKITIEEVTPANSDIAITEVVEEKIQ